LARRENRPRGVIDTSVLVAGVAGFKSWRAVRNPSASFLRDWLEHATFNWLVSEDIISEYKEVLTGLGVRRNLVGEVINLVREEAEIVDVRTTSDASPDPDDNSFCACAEQGRAAFIATLNPKDFPQRKLRAKVISPGDPVPTTRRRNRSGSR
jgi:predicted nucleic acid-binding protein